jgi:hypothetical protein
MSTNQTPPDFDEDFLLAIKNWREKYKIQEGDTTLLLLELFRIHQDHWDELRRRQMPSLDQFRQDIASTVEVARSLKEQTAAVTKALKDHPATIKTVPLTSAAFAALFTFLAGALIAIALL